jgi:hypothetical protein
MFLRECVFRRSQLRALAPVGVYRGLMVAHRFYPSRKSSGHASADAQKPMNLPPIVRWMDSIRPRTDADALAFDLQHTATEDNTATSPGAQVRNTNAPARLQASQLSVQLSTSTEQGHSERLRAESSATSPPAFGTAFTDHMLEVEWSKEDGWGAPRIVPFHDISVHPAAHALHYAVEIFEGLKAYSLHHDHQKAADAGSSGVATDGSIPSCLLFRPLDNMIRMNLSAARMTLPTFDPVEMVGCVYRCIRAALMFR